MNQTQLLTSKITLICGAPDKIKRGMILNIAGEGILMVGDVYTTDGDAVYTGGCGCCSERFKIERVIGYHPGLSGVEIGE